MIATIAAVCLALSDKDASVIAIRPPADHVVVLPVKPKVTPQSAEWRWYVFSDRAWTGVESEFFHDSLPLEKDKVMVIEVSLLLDSKPLPVGGFRLAVKQGIHYAVFNVGDKVDLSHSSGGSQSMGQIVQQFKSLDEFVKDKLVKKETLSLPQRIECADTTFPVPKAYLKIFKKDGSGKETVGSSRWYEASDPPGPLPLTAAERDLLANGYQLQGSGGEKIPNTTYFLSLSK